MPSDDPQTSIPVPEGPVIVYCGWGACGKTAVHMDIDVGTPGVRKNRPPRIHACQEHFDMIQRNIADGAAEREARKNDPLRAALERKR